LPAVAPKKGFYSVASTPAKERTVRDLVTKLGESVVQVRTPAGLGSGFFLNDEGYLLPNFHVTEGETQISVEVYHQKDGQLDRKTYKQVRIIALNKFADLALKHSECPTALQGGVLGIVPRGKLYPELDAVLFSLKVGAVSDIVESEIGFHLLLCKQKSEKVDRQNFPAFLQ